MKITGSALQKTFIINHKGKDYHIDYLNSDHQILGLLNRDYWQITEENGEELQIYTFKKDSKKQKEQTKSNKILTQKLINFCIKNFNKYNPKLH